MEWDACHDSDFDFDSAQTLRRSDPARAPAALPPSGPDRRSPAASLLTPDDATCEHCAELAARCAAADAAARHLSATLNRLRSTLDAAESLAERQARTSRAASDTSTRSKVNSTRTAMLCDGSRPYPPEIPRTLAVESGTRTGLGPGPGRGRGGLRRERSTDALGVHKVHGGKRYEAYLPGKLTEIVPGDVPGA